MNGNHATLTCSITDSRLRVNLELFVSVFQICSHSQELIQYPTTSKIVCLTSAWLSFKYSCYFESEFQVPLPSAGFLFVRRHSIPAVWKWTKLFHLLFLLYLITDSWLIVDFELLKKFTEECNHCILQSVLDQNAASDNCLTVWIVTCLFNPLFCQVQIKQKKQWKDCKVTTYVIFTCRSLEVRLSGLEPNQILENWMPIKHVLISLKLFYQLQISIMNVRTAVWGKLHKTEKTLHSSSIKTADDLLLALCSITSSRPRIDLSS